MSKFLIFFHELLCVQITLFQMNGVAVLLVFSFQKVGVIGLVFIYDNGAIVFVKAYRK